MPKYFLELLYEFVLKYQNHAHTYEGDVVVQCYEDNFRCSVFSHASRFRPPTPGYPTGQLTAHLIPHKKKILQSVLNSVQVGIKNKPYLQALKFPVRSYTPGRVKSATARVTRIHQLGFPSYLCLCPDNNCSQTTEDERCELHCEAILTHQRHVGTQALL